MDPIKHTVSIFSLLWFAFTLHAQQTVTGKVTTQSDGQPLPGVSIIQKGTTNGITTDFDGNFKIQMAVGSTLVFSHIGFLTQEVPIAATTINLQTVMVENLTEKCPCVLYCSASGTGSYNLNTVVTTGAVNNINYSGEQPSGNYEYYSDETLKVSRGNSFNMTTTQSNNWSITGVWVDWNADGDFKDTDEKVQVFGATNQLNDGPFSAQIQVPNTAISGNVRMRILTGDAWTTDLTVEPCGEIANSTIKDFNIEIL